jgi:hypothetical protein
MPNFILRTVGSKAILQNKFDVWSASIEAGQAFEKRSIYLINKH